MKPELVPQRSFIVRYWSWFTIAGLAILVWLPRLTGPLDLRYDGGVYYILGSSLAGGHGYRILSEPGSPQALQYPPLLPALVALHAWALGTTDPETVAPWLRISYAVTFVGYALLVLVLARRYLSSGFAFAAAALCLLYFETIFLSDLLFAELPLAVVAVAFVILARPHPQFRPWLKEIVLFGLAAAGFLLKTAGVVLLAAYALEAVVRRRWMLALGRGALALLPLVAWQQYIARVRTSYEYKHPAYEYQRAPYQYYNVSYADNVALVDPFQPELGRLTASSFAKRMLCNLPSLVIALGEGVSAKEKPCAEFLERVQQKLFHRGLIPGSVMYVPISAAALLVIAGLTILIRQRAWMPVFIVLISIALVWLTPWPGQYLRYLVPFGGFLCIAVMVALSGLYKMLPASGPFRTVGLIALACIFVLIFTIEAYPSAKMFRLRANEEARVFPLTGKATRYFAHDRPWQAWEEAAAWIKAQARADAVVATTAPHFLYLRTGLQAVLPPMEANPTIAKKLLEGVPVTYLIVDQLEFLDISRRYALPAMKYKPDTWQLVHSVGGTQVYEHQSPKQ